MYRVAIVCEGPADRAVIEAVLDHYLDDYVPVHIQPPTGAIGGSAGPFGGGWKGVRTWCEQEVAARGGLSTVGVVQNADLLVLQVDADIAHDPDLDCARPCPPPDDTVAAVSECVLGWLGVAKTPSDTVLCIPSLASETWVLAALFPEIQEVDSPTHAVANSVCLECREDAKFLLRKHGKRLSPKLVVSQQGALKNQAAAFRAHGRRITNGWPNAMRACTQAARFGQSLSAILPHG